MFDNLTLDEARHHATLFAALFMSDHWNNSWLDYRTMNTSVLNIGV